MLWVVYLLSQCLQAYTQVSLEGKVRPSPSVLLPSWPQSLWDVNYVICSFHLSLNRTGNTGQGPARIFVTMLTAPTTVTIILLYKRRHQIPSRHQKLQRDQERKEKDKKAVFFRYSMGRAVLFSIWIIYLCRIKKTEKPNWFPGEKLVYFCIFFLFFFCPE